MSGESCPPFTVEAAVSGKTISPETLNGKRAVLVFHGPRTADAPKTVGKAVRSKYTSADEVVVANIVNLKSMAGLWKKVADAQIKATYEKMAEKIGEGAEDFVIICPDYENAVADAFGFDDTNKTAVVVVVGKDGSILGSSDSGDLGAAAIGLLS